MALSSIWRPTIRTAVNAAMHVPTENYASTADAVTLRILCWFAATRPYTRQQTRPTAADAATNALNIYVKMVHAPDMAPKHSAAAWRSISALMQKTAVNAEMFAEKASFVWLANAN